MKAHLLDSLDPLKEGSDLLANCLTPVPNAQFVFLWDNDNYPEFLSVSMTRICRQCAQSALKGRYVYGIVPGAEIGQTEADLVAVA